MPRKARLDSPGVLHHVMIRGIERRNIFGSDRDRNDLIERLASALPGTTTACYAWAFMPNHAHFLFRSGPAGIATLMRKLLTGYVVSFNRRHHRAGQLFQNRYKSIICEEDGYFKELVRYIHLNPIRSRIVATLAELDRFAFSGHSAIMGNRQRDWQDTNGVIAAFSSPDDYRAFVEQGMGQGRREELSGGRLVRSLGGWSEAKSDRRVKGDQRILGGSAFVMRLLSEADQHLERGYLAKSRGITCDTIAEAVCCSYGIDRDQLFSRSRQRRIAEARGLFCSLCVSHLGTALTDLARLLGITPAAVYYAVRRGGKTALERGDPIDVIE